MSQTAIKEALADARARRDTRQQGRLTKELRAATTRALMDEAKRMKTVNIADIRVNGGTQSRAAISPDVVAEYADAIEGGAVFPPVVLFFDGAAYWLADGFHRYEAFARLNMAEVAADIRQGTQRDAILYSVGANAAHGLRRTNDDKRRAVLVLLADAEWAKWSNREMARQCGVSEGYVRSLRTERSEAPRTYTTKHGTVATMDTAKIGKGKTKPAESVAAGDGPVPAMRGIFADMSDEQREAAMSYRGIEASGTAMPEPQPETAPGEDADPNADARKVLRALTREGLEDEVIGLRAENAELRAALADERAKRKKMKSQLADLTADDKDEVIRRLQRQVEHQKSQMFRANEDARIAVRARRKAEDARDEALKRLGDHSEVVPY